MRSRSSSAPRSSLGGKFSAMSRIWWSLSFRAVPDMLGESFGYVVCCRGWKSEIEEANARSSVQNAMMAAVGFRDAAKEGVNALRG